MSKPFRTFYVVTRSGSVYRVEDGAPAKLEKIALFGDSAASPGTKKTGELVGITMDEGLILYNQDFSPFSGERERCQYPEEVNTRYWWWNTTEIVAIFFDEERARVCAESVDLVPWDPRWSGESTKTICEVVRDSFSHATASPHCFREYHNPDPELIKRYRAMLETVHA